MGWGGRGCSAGRGQLRPCRGITGCCLPWKALSQALGRLEKKQADKEELLVLGIDEVRAQGAPVPVKGVPGRVTNTPCPLGAGWQNQPGGGRISSPAAGPLPGPSVAPSPFGWWDQRHGGDGVNRTT